MAGLTRAAVLRLGVAEELGVGDGEEAGHRDDGRAVLRLQSRHREAIRGRHGTF